MVGWFWGGVGIVLGGCRVIVTVFFFCSIFQGCSLLNTFIIFDFKALVNLSGFGGVPKEEGPVWEHVYVYPFGLGLSPWS